jgi:hypothetical protein
MLQQKILKPSIQEVKAAVLSLHEENSNIYNKLKAINPNGYSYLYKRMVSLKYIYDLLNQVQEERELKTAIDELYSTPDEINPF